MLYLEENCVVQEESSLLEVLKVIGPGAIGFVAGLIPYFNTKRKTKADIAISYQQQLINQYNHIVKRVETLEEEKTSTVEELLKAKAKIQRLELKISEEFNLLGVLRSYYTHMPKPAWLKAPNGVMYFINDAYQDLFGVSKLAYEGQMDESIWGSEIASYFKESDLQVIDKRKGLVFKERYPVAPNSDVFMDVETMKFPVMNKSQLIGVGGVILKNTPPNQ